MAEKMLIRNIRIVNEEQIILTDLLIHNGVIQRIQPHQNVLHANIIDGTGKC